MNTVARPPRRSRPRTQAGFSLLDVLIGAAVLAIALLSQATGTLSGHRLARCESRHGVAVETLRAFTERLRADLDWPSLYERLVDRRIESPAGAPTTAYYADFRTPAELGDVRVRIHVPQSSETAAGSESAFGMDASAGDGEWGMLREDVTDPRFGLPYDLNGDGLLDAEARDADYLTLPVVIDFQWDAPGDTLQRIRMQTWLKGERI